MSGLRRDPMTVPRPILLRAGALTVGIAPQCGGSLASLEAVVNGKPVDILRRATERSDGRPCSLGASCFPLVPYGGRLREGRFRFDGCDYQYPLNAGLDWR